MDGGERSGGHTLTRHVGFTEAQLADRIANEGLRTTSSFSDRASEEQLGDILIYDLDCCYDPQFQGMSDVEWLRWVRTSLKQGISKLETPIVETRFLGKTGFLG